MSETYYQRVKAKGGAEYAALLEKNRANVASYYQRAKADGGAEYAALLEKSRVQQAARRKALGGAEREAYLEKRRVRQAARRKALGGEPYYQRVKAKGGAAYTALLEKQRSAKQKQRDQRRQRGEGRPTYDKKTPAQIKARQKRRKATLEGHQKHLIQTSRHRARKKGLEHSITWHDLEWPEVCPVLGLRLIYGSIIKNTLDRNAFASLDRLDNTRGYVPGNVHVISYRANALKNNGGAAEIEAVARYAKYGIDQPPLGLEDVW